MRACKCSLTVWNTFKRLHTPSTGAGSAFRRACVWMGSVLYPYSAAATALLHSEDGVCGMGRHVEVEIEGFVVSRLPCHTRSTNVLASLQHSE